MHNRHCGDIYTTEAPESLKTPVSYTKEEIRRIRQMKSSGTLCNCPSCGEILNDVTSVAGSGSQGQLFVVNCHSCNRMAFLPVEKARNKGLS